jgi:hypothetical protein
MKRIVILILLICISSIAYAHSGGGFLQLGFGMGILDDNEVHLDVDLKWLFFSLEHSKTGLGISFVFINYRYLLNYHYLSIFTNFEIYWNMFGLIPEEKRSVNIIFGPFAYINYPPFTNNPNYSSKYYLLCYGMKFNYGPELKILNIECGGRMLENKNHFYFNIGIEISYTGTLLWYILRGGVKIIKQNGT